MQGSMLYCVEDSDDNTIMLKSAEVSEILPKQVRLVEGETLFGCNRVSKHDPRVSLVPRKAITAYIIRKKRQVADLTGRKKIRNDQLKLAKVMLERVKKCTSAV